MLLQHQCPKPLPSMYSTLFVFTVNLKSWSDFWAGGDFIFSDRSHCLYCSIVLCLLRSSSKFHLTSLNCNSVANIVVGNGKCAYGPVVHYPLCLSSTYSHPSSDFVSGDNDKDSSPLEYFIYVSTKK